jgi:hypothetical protein
MEVSLLVQVTVVPTLTVSVAGEKAKLDIVTELLETGVKEVDEHAVRVVTPIKTSVINKR